MKALEAWQIAQMIYTSAGCVKFNERIDEHLMEAEMKSEKFSAPPIEGLEKLNSNFSRFKHIVEIILVIALIIFIPLYYAGYKSQAVMLGSAMMFVCGISWVTACIMLAKSYRISKRNEKKAELIKDVMDWREASIACMSRAIFLEKLEKIGLQFSPEEEKAVSGVLNYE